MSKKTQPPKPFTDATLLSAMTGIARFVQDKELKKIEEQLEAIPVGCKYIVIAFEPNYLIGTEDATTYLDKDHIKKIINMV